MRNKTFQPGFLFNFPHAMRFKGAGAPAVQPPAMTPPPALPPAPREAVDLNTARANYVNSPDALPNYTDSGFVDWWDANKSTSDINQNAQDYDLMAALAASGDARAAGIIGVTPGKPVTNEPPVAPPAPAVPPPIDTGVGMNLGTPAVPAGPQTAAPPASDKSSEVRDAQREARRKAGRRKGYLSTLLARETGGYQGGEQKTLLGQ